MFDADYQSSQFSSPLWKYEHFETLVRLLICLVEKDRPSRLEVVGDDLVLLEKGLGVLTRRILGAVWMIDELSEVFRGMGAS